MGKVLCTVLLFYLIFSSNYVASVFFQSFFHFSHSIPPLSLSYTHTPPLALCGMVCVHCSCCSSGTIAMLCVPVLICQVRFWMQLGWEGSVAGGNSRRLSLSLSFLFFFLLSQAPLACLTVSVGSVHCVANFLSMTLCMSWPPMAWHGEPVIDEVNIR